ncbi:MAG: 50S ribosomal protein L19 [Anaerohalosphaeraceae bacterium]
MKDKLIQAVEAKSIKAEKPYFEIGDTVEVHCKIQEGDKARIQIFSGVVIARRGSKMNEMFTVRRMVGEQGVERIFPINSPNIEKVVPIRSGKARRAKLYYLRGRTGKGVKLSQRHSEHTSGK